MIHVFTSAWKRVKWVEFIGYMGEWTYSEIIISSKRNIRFGPIYQFGEIIETVKKLYRWTSSKIGAKILSNSQIADDSHESITIKSKIWRSEGYLVVQYRHCMCAFLINFKIIKLRMILSHATDSRQYPPFPSSSVFRILINRKGKK